MVLAMAAVAVLAHMVSIWGESVRFLLSLVLKAQAQQTKGAEALELRARRWPEAVVARFSGAIGWRA